MVSRAFTRAAALAAVCGLAAAQTDGYGCDRAKESCPPNIAFGGEATYDFTTASSIADLEGFWIVDGGIKFGDPTILTFDKGAGARFTISKDNQAPTLVSKNYLFFGKVEVTVQAAPGKGIVTAVTLLSDTLDELDWEWVGEHHGEVETNYYHNDPKDHTNAKTIPLSFNPEATTHTYTIDWTPTYITWSIDGNVVRSAKPADSPGKWPQTPAHLKIGTWCGGCSFFNDAPGTQTWAGGKADWVGAPYSAVFKSIKVTDYGGGHAGATEYVWEDLSGDWRKIKVVGGTKHDLPSAPGAGPADNPPPPSKTGSTVAPPAPTNPPKNAPVDAGHGNSTSKPTTTTPAPAPAKTTSTSASSSVPTGAAPRHLVSLAGIALMGLAYVA